MIDPKKKFFDLKAVEWKLLDQGNSPCIMVKCRVIEGVETGMEKVYWGSLHENAAQYTFEALRAFGWTGEDVETELDVAHGMGTARAVGVEADHEWPPGEIKRKLKYINPYKPRESKGTTGSKVKGLGKRFKALAKSVTIDVDPAAKVAPSTDDDESVDSESAPF